MWVLPHIVLAALLELLLNKPLTRINALSTDKIRFNIPPQLVGADRVANSVAATERYGYPVIVADFGTATNLDVVISDVGRRLLLTQVLCDLCKCLFARSC